MSSINAIKNHLIQLPTYIVEGVADTKAWINTKITAVKDKFLTSNLWTKDLKPLYDRRIAPLNKLDLAIITGGLAIAITVAILAFTTFNIAYFPLAAMTSVLIAGATLSISNYRVKRHHDAIAVTKLSELEQNVIQLQMPTHDFTTIDPYFEELFREPEYQHRKQEWELLKEQRTSFENCARKVTLTPNATNHYEEARRTFVTHLQRLQKRLS